MNQTGSPSPSGGSTGVANSNTPRILKALAERGLVIASDTRPTVWNSRDHA